MTAQCSTGSSRYWQVPVASRCRNSTGSSRPSILRVRARQPRRFCPKPNPNQIVRMQKIVPVLMVALLAGCSSVRHVGQIGSTQLHRVSLKSLDGPNVTALLAEDPETGRLDVIATGATPGIATAIVGAGG